MPRRRAQCPREGVWTSVCGAFEYPRVLASVRDVKSRHRRLQRIRLVLKPRKRLTPHHNTTHRNQPPQPAIDKKQATRTGKKREQNNVAEPLAHPTRRRRGTRAGVDTNKAGAAPTLASENRGHPGPVIVEETLGVHRRLPLRFTTSAATPTAAAATSVPAAATRTIALPPVDGSADVECTPTLCAPLAAPS